jgi:hypothetical protein
VTGTAGSYGRLRQRASGGEKLKGRVSSSADRAKLFRPGRFGKVRQAGARALLGGVPRWSKVTRAHRQRRTGPTQRLELAHPFGNLATLWSPMTSKGPWLCVAALRRVCLCRGDSDHNQPSSAALEMSLPRAAGIRHFFINPRSTTCLCQIAEGSTYFAGSCG